MKQQPIHSSLYKCKVMHHRIEPKRNSFHYNIFMFYLDLDEIPALARKLWFMGHNKFNLFNFRDADHIEFPREQPVKGRTVRENIMAYLASENIHIGKGRIMLMTNLCTLGYVFNPVSFFFCYNEDGTPECCIVETCNTFLERKPYLLRKESYTDKGFIQQVTKYFYVSPFIDMDTSFDFNIRVPEEKLNIQINDIKDGKKFFFSSLTGTRKKLNDATLLWYAIRFPFITLKIIALIHFQALILWMKGLAYHKKDANLDLQKEIYNPMPN